MELLSKNFKNSNILPHIQLKRISLGIGYKNRSKEWQNFYLLKQRKYLLCRELNALPYIRGITFAYGRSKRSIKIRSEYL